MRLGIALPTVGGEHDRALLLSAARAADRLGFDSVWAPDHILMSYTRRSSYPYPWSGTEVSMQPGVRWLDSLTALATAAGVTKKVRLGTGVLVLPYRNPVLLAGEAATLDVLCGGRLILGVGVGWMREEFAALGVPASERAARTDEHIEVMRTLWRDDPASFFGRFTSFEDVVLGARPRTPGGPPIWVGGNTEPALRRALRYGDAWHGFEVFAKDMPGVRASLERLAPEVGRDPGELELTVARGLMPPEPVGERIVLDRQWLGGERPSAESIVDELGRLEAQGLSLCVLQVAVPAVALPETLEWVAREVASKL